MEEMPHETTFDSTLALLVEGYEFIPNRCRKHRSDVFETRLMLQRVVCMSGPDAAETFYGDGRFTSGAPSRGPRSPCCRTSAASRDWTGPRTITASRCSWSS